jgi:hypothetical protein
MGLTRLFTAILVRLVKSESDRRALPEVDFIEEGDIGYA